MLGVIILSSLAKHHFVPWSYLRYFAIDPKAPRKTSTINMWDKKANVERIQKTDSVKCYVRGQNTVDELPDPEFYEKRYAEVDAALGKIIILLLQTLRQASSDSAFNPQYKEMLAQYIMLLFKRQPTVLMDALSKTEDAIDIVKEMMHTEYKGILTTPKIERLLDSKSTKQLALELSMELVGDGVEVLRNKVWIYCRNETDVPFVTSDYPLCPHIISSYNGKGMADPGCAFFFPVAPDALIYMIDSVHFLSDQKEYFDNAIEPIYNRDFVLIANHLQHSNCTRQIYSNITLSPVIYTHPDEIENGIVNNSSG